MTLQEFRVSIENGAPPANASRALLGLWHARAGDWDAAHRAVQEDATVDCAWVHAHLHRVEGDESNAGYWYRKANRRFPELTLDEEWEAIAAVLIEGSAQ